MLKRLFHLNFNVSNIDRSIDFYGGLGFGLVNRMEVETPDLGVPLGFEARALRTAFLALPERGGLRGPLLDLVEFVTPRPRGKPYESLLNRGIGRVALWTHDVGAARERALSLGARLVAPAFVMTGPGGNRMETVCFTDPDGITLQLFGPVGAGQGDA